MFHSISDRAENLTWFGRGDYENENKKRAANQSVKIYIAIFFFSLLLRKSSAEFNINIYFLRIYRIKSLLSSLSFSQHCTQRYIHCNVDDIHQIEVNERFVCSLYRICWLCYLCIHWTDIPWDGKAFAVENWAPAQTDWMWRESAQQKKKIEIQRYKWIISPEDRPIWIDLFLFMGFCTHFLLFRPLTTCLMFFIFSRIIFGHFTFDVGCVKNVLNYTQWNEKLVVRGIILRLIGHAFHIPW